ncbi:MAG: hypothetical protein LAP40_11695 [Acidobacteriia bacterium]|nr:hypothetical protein [Terriglobia bacterium]
MPSVCPGIATGELITSIQAAQNPDGGWGYQGRSSWSEPTAFALLALAATHSTSIHFERGLGWLRSTQRADGGWAPHPSVAESTWVTAVAVLALCEADDGGSVLGPAVAWLQRQSGEESTLTDRLRRLLLGARMEAGEGTKGWPWLAGTAGWVMPTALTILALEKAERRAGSAGARARIQQGRDFLLARICRDGGWNYGGVQALGFSANSYPDTTGMALLALHGVESPVVRMAVEKAAKQWPECHSAQTACWLHLGLEAHGMRPATAGDCRLENANLLDRALVALARAPEEGGAKVWGAL